MKKVLIIGAGAMGAAFSVPLIDNNQKVTLTEPYNLNLLKKLKNKKKFHPALKINLSTKLNLKKFNLELLNEINCSVEIVDLRTLIPLDTEMIYKSVKKTGKALVLHEDCMTGGFGADISSLISENCFEYLDAPVLRCSSLDTPVPFSNDLENNFLAKSRLKQKVTELSLY